MSAEKLRSMSSIREELGARYGLLSAFTAFIAANPGFRHSQVYHPASCQCADCQAKRGRPKADGRGRPRVAPVVVSVG
jgi:hypothetical protein